MVICMVIGMILGMVIGKVIGMAIGMAIGFEILVIGMVQPPTKKNCMVTALKSKVQELGFAFKNGNHNVLLCGWL